MISNLGNICFDLHGKIEYIILKKNFSPKKNYTDKQTMIQRSDDVLLHHCQKQTFVVSTHSTCACPSWTKDTKGTVKLINLKQTDNAVSKNEVISLFVIQAVSFFSFQLFYYCYFRTFYNFICSMCFLIVKALTVTYSYLRLDKDSDQDLCNRRLLSNLMRYFE